MKTEHGFYIHELLAQNLEVGKTLMHDDWDIVILVDGRPGVGKSCLTFQAAKYVDPEFNIDKVCFTSEEFKKALEEAKPYSAIVFDEAFRGFSSRKSRSVEVEEVLTIFQECRQKNLIIFLTSLSFYRLISDVAVFRSLALLNVYAKPKEQKEGDDKSLLARGHFAYYTYQQKLHMYNNPKYKRGFIYPNECAFRGNFPHHWVIDKKVYNAKKTESFEKFVKEKEATIEERREKHKASSREHARRKLGIEPERFKL